jgi:hypothetical protein
VRVRCEVGTVNVVAMRQFRTLGEGDRWGEKC